MITQQRRLPGNNLFYGNPGNDNNNEAVQNINNTFDGTTNLMTVVPVSHAPTTSMQKRGVNQVGLNRSYLIQKAAANSKIQKTKPAERVSNERLTSGAGAKPFSNLPTG